MVVIDLDETMVTKSRYPIRAVVESVNRLACRVFVLTGREEAQREQTLKDLDFARIVYDELSLMPTIDMNIAEYKRATVERLLVDYDVLAFVDDNDDNRAAVESLDVYVMTPDEFVDAAVNSGLFAEDEDLVGYETREVSRVAPSFMAASARRGLRLHEEGESGDGLMPATVADAGRMVNGEPLSVDKWRRIPGWIARHMMDLDAVDGDEITPGLVAMLLWGGGSSKSSARRTQAYAERMVERLAADEERAQPRKPNGQFGTGGGGDTPAAGDGGAAQPYSKSKPGSEKYADSTQEKMRDEQASAVGDMGLSSPERGAINNYTHSGHKNVNKAARGAPPPPLEGKKLATNQKRADIIDGVIQRSPPISSPIVVERGVNIRALGARQSGDIEGLVGSEFTDNGIISTTLSSKTAMQFQRGTMDTTMVINVPKGSKAYAVPDALEYFNPMDASFEREVLLPRGTKFKITNYDKGKNKVYVDVVSTDGRAATVNSEERAQPRKPNGQFGSGSDGGAPTTGGEGDAPAGNGDAPRAPRPGMGDVPLDAGTVASMRGGSGEKHLETLPDGTVQFTAERQALHDQIVQSTLDGVPSSANPTLHMMGGGAAAGKSSMVSSGQVEIPGKGQAAQLNVDDTRRALPEYGAGLAAGDTNISAFTHEESSYVTKRAMQAGFERKTDIVLDGTGNSSATSLNKKIDGARANGYQVNGYYATVPVATAIQRSDARGNNPNSPDFGRFVPHAVIGAQHAAVARVLPTVAPRFDSVKLFDTSGATPRLLMQGGKGTMTIVDQAGFDSFKAIGDG